MVGILPLERRPASPFVLPGSVLASYRTPAAANIAEWEEASRSDRMFDARSGG
jgi:hypothetical protein